MRVNRRDFTLGSLLAAGTLGLPVFVKAQQGKTVALLFDSLVSPFWVSGLDIMREKAKANGWQVLENISNFDDNKQFEQVKAMIGRKVDGILIIQTDSKAVIPAIRAANEAGIPMVHFNRPPAESDAYSVAIQADNRKIAAETVQFMVDEAKKTGTQAQGRDHDRRSRRRERDPAPRRLLRRGRQEQGHGRGGGARLDRVERRQGLRRPDQRHAGQPRHRLPVHLVRLHAAADRAGAGDVRQVAQDRRGRPRAARRLRRRRQRLPVDRRTTTWMPAASRTCSSRSTWRSRPSRTCGPARSRTKLLLDPGFVITQANKDQTRDEMWGYIVWQKNGSKP